ncbi:Magnetosome protein MamH [Gammaproteobacteria bacterium]
MSLTSKREGCRNCVNPCGLEESEAQLNNDVKVELLQPHHHNALYLVVAVVMILMTFIVALQPLYLSEILGLAYNNAGFVNANIQVISEVLDLILVGYLGYLSDRIGRVSLLVYGFLFTGFMALFAPFDKEIAIALGLSALLVFYIIRILMSLGTTLIWPQMITLAGDYSNPGEPSRLVINVGFMMAFGVSLVYTVFMQLPKYIGLKYIMVMIAVIAFTGGWLAKNFLMDMPIFNRKQIQPPLSMIFSLIKKKKNLSLSLMAAFTSRNDMVVIGLFLMTWFIYFADLIPGMTHVQAASQGGIVIGFMGGVVLLSIPFWGKAIENLGTVIAMAVALLLTGCGFAILGLIINPLGWWILVPVALVGIGQAGCLMASQILVLEQAPQEIRGTVLGVFNTVGCIGVIFFLQVGGFLFDWIGPTAPFTMVGMANLLTFGYALLVIKHKDIHNINIQAVSNDISNERCNFPTEI